MKFATYDIESRNWIHFVVLGFFDGKDYYIFHGKNGIDKFLKHLNKKEYDGLVIYGHNAGKYDIYFLLDKLLNDYFVDSIIEVGSSIISLRAYLGKATVNFCDSYRLLPDSLEKILEAWNSKYKKVHIDFDNDEISIRNSKLMKHLENDVKGLYFVLEDFRNSEFVINGELKLTIGSQALDTFSKKFLNAEIETLQYKDEENFRQKFYHGGRVEVFKGSGNCYYYDINSLFPLAMLYEMPIGEYQKVRTYQKGAIGFYEVEVKRIPNFYIPPFLFSTNLGNYYVNGNGRYYVSSIMLEYLKSEYGIKFDIIRGWIFKKKEAILKDYVNYYYEIKKSNKGNSKGLIAKYFLNTLYGKFGQNRNKEVIKQLSPNLTNYASFDNDFNLVLVIQKNKNKFILPHLATWITEIARFEHWKRMQEIGEDSIFYCDTDSIFTYRQVKTGKEIGDLKLEGYGKGYFLQPKTYVHGDKVVFKGFSKMQELKNKIIEAFESKKEIKITQKRLLSFRENLNLSKETKRNIIDEVSPFLRLCEFTKTTEGLYSRRKIIPSNRFVFDSIAFTQKEAKKGEGIKCW
jgi:hypothetical protein